MPGCTNLSVPNIIRKKRDNKELEENEIQFIIDRIVTSTAEEKIHESQIGAFLMASFLNGFTQNETASMVKAMTSSGFQFNWPSEWKGTMVDKHSTGGVGDKVSLVLAPALAACGLRVPMISGRGLDYTGGTLDKLESIPGFSVRLTKEKFTEVLGSVGCCIMGQTNDIAPADKVIYSIRDTTATVDNQDFIVASIISKKAAEGLDALVLDVKFGKGAIMQTYSEAKSLAQKLVSAGSLYGMKVSAFLTNMDDPLGKAVGNALEVAESIECLQDKGPRDLVDITSTLGGKLLQSVGKCTSLEEGKELIEKSLKTGTALKKFHEMIVKQGAEEAVAKELCYGDMWKHLPKAKKTVDVPSPKSGYVKDIDALAIAKLCHGLGCGRTNPNDPIKFEPGVVLVKKPGDFVKEKECLIRIHMPNGCDSFCGNEIDIMSVFNIVDTKPETKSLILEML